MHKPPSPRTRLRRHDPVTELWMLVSVLFALTLLATLALSATLVR